MRGNHTLMFLFLSFSISSPLSKNKYKKSLRKKQPENNYPSAYIDILMLMYRLLFQDLLNVKKCVLTEEMRKRNNLTMTGIGLTA